MKNRPKPDRVAWASNGTDKQRRSIPAEPEQDPSPKEVLENTEAANKKITVLKKDTTKAETA